MVKASETEQLNATFVYKKRQFNQFEIFQFYGQKSFKWRFFPHKTWIIIIPWK